MTRRLAVLTPVRNGADDLPGYFRSVERFADFVIALDDGSTDPTSAMLESSEIVAKILANPRRPSFAGWNDASNRQRLLDAVEDFDDVGWVFFLDADERVDEADAAALRSFVEGDAYGGFAYGFEVVRMVGGLERFDADSGMWVYRMFGYQPGLQLPSTRLHFVPIPLSIDRRRWIRTTLRIQHVGSATEERRTRRFRKYQEADPNLEYQTTYVTLLETPTEVSDWSPRLPQTPVVVSNETQFAVVAAGLEETEMGRPVLSAVVISRDDEHTIAQSVQALADQELDEPFEIIVVTSGTDRTAEVVATTFPSVRVIQLPQPALPGEARNAGLWVARGHYISFPGSHVVVAAGSLQARVDAHEAGWDLVTGTTLNGNTTTTGWASYFLDHSAVLPGRPSGELGAAPSHCSYVRSDLDELGGFPEDMRAGEDTVVNLELFRRGRRAYRQADAAIIHTSRAESVTQMARHHFGRGRAWGRILLSHSGSRRRLLWTGIRPILVAPVARTRLVARNVAAWGGSMRPEYRKARWHVAAGALAAGAGTIYQVLRGGRTRTELAGSPQVAVIAPPPLVVAHCGSPAAAEFGVLGSGPIAAAADRLSRHVDRQPAGTAAAAMYVVAVAATVIPGRDGSYTATLSDEDLHNCLAEARRIGARLILGVQPGRGSLRRALARVEHMLTASDVGIGLQPQYGDVGDAPVAWPRTDVEAALDRLDDIVDHPLLVLIHDTATTSWPADWSTGTFDHLDIVGVTDIVGGLDAKAAALARLARRAPALGLQVHYRRDPETPEPEDLARRFPDLRILVYS